MLLSYYSLIRDRLNYRPNNTSLFDLKIYFANLPKEVKSFASTLPQEAIVMQQGQHCGSQEIKTINKRVRLQRIKRSMRSCDHGRSGSWVVTMPMCRLWSCDVITAGMLGERVTHGWATWCISSPPPPPPPAPPPPPPPPRWSTSHPGGLWETLRPPGSVEHLHFTDRICLDSIVEELVPVIISCSVVCPCNAKFLPVHKDFFLVLVYRKALAWQLFTTTTTTTNYYYYYYYRYWIIIQYTQRSSLYSP